MNESDDDHDDDKDIDFVPERVIFSVDTITKCRYNINSITSAFNMSQIDFIISETKCGP